MELFKCGPGSIPCGGIKGTFPDITFVEIEGIIRGRCGTRPLATWSESNMGGRVRDKVGGK